MSFFHLLRRHQQLRRPDNADFQLLFVSLSHRKKLFAVCCGDAVLHTVFRHLIDYGPEKGNELPFKNEYPRIFYHSFFRFFSAARHLSF